MWDQSQPEQSMQSEHLSQLFGQEIFGMRFCQKCRNLMKPFHGNGHLLDYLCERCNKTVSVDYSEKEGKQCLLYSKELQIGSRKVMADPAYVFDPAMPRVQVECPQCGNSKAVYILTPDEGETKLKVVMICSSTSGNVVKCGHSWVLDQGAELLQYRVKTEEELYFENFQA